MRMSVVPVALFALTLPATVTAGVFYITPDRFLSEHPRETMAQAWLVRVKPGAKARFYTYDTDRGCPARTDACKARGHLEPGDIAVAVQADGAFTYVEFTGSTGKSRLRAPSKVACWSVWSLPDPPCRIGSATGPTPTKRTLWCPERTTRPFWVSSVRPCGDPTIRPA